MAADGLQRQLHVRRRLVLAVQQRQAQIHVRDRQRPIDPECLTECGNGTGVVELLESGDAAVVRNIRPLERVPARRSTAARNRPDADGDQQNEDAARRRGWGSHRSMLLRFRP